MKHQMKLRSHPFYMIRSGQKTYELRLYDEKRQRLQVNDEIEFRCLDKDETPFVGDHPKYCVNLRYGVE